MMTHGFQPSEEELRDMIRLTMHVIVHTVGEGFKYMMVYTISHIVHPLEGFREMRMYAI